MKKHLLAGLLITGMTAVAQTPRLSLYEEFTGETCPPCAATNPGLNALLALPTNTTKIVAIKWQVPIPSAPSATWSLYQTNKTEIDWRWRSAASGGYGYTPAINSAPSSKIDGREATVFGAQSGHPAYLTSNVISTAQSYTSAFSVTMARAWNPTFTSVTLTVNITASANFTATGNLIFRTVMVEKQIHFATQPGTNGEKDFDDAVIASFPTIQNGVSMAGTWITGQTQTFTLNCPLPSYTRDKSEVAFVGFIQDDGNQRVAQAVRSNPEPVTNDAKAYLNIPPVCGTSFAPKVSVKNNGSNVITSFDINPTINGVAGTMFSWSGSLAVGATTLITLPNTAILGGINNFSYTISNVSGTDNNIVNNNAATKFVAIPNYNGTSVAEGFQATFPPANFFTYNNYNGASWALNTAVGGFGTSTQSTKLDFYATVPSGAVNELYIPATHVTSVGATMWFDVAYAQYTAQDADQLDIVVSDDCGATWTNVYSKNGAGLSTTGPAGGGAFTPQSTEWRTDTVSLTSYANKDILIKFVGTSDYGNNLYLDNINLSFCAIQTLSATTANENICRGETATIKVTGAASFGWSNSAAATTGTQIVQPTETTTYMINSTDPARCNDASTSIVVNVDECTGVKMLSADQFKVTIYPNPSNGETSISMNSNTSGKATLSVINTLGQVVYKKATTLNSGANTLQLDVKGFAVGLYNVVIETEQGSTVKKLTVSK